MNYDVLIVGSGPSGLATAINLKNLAQKSNHQISIAIIEKSSSIGGHILSGCIFNYQQLDSLILNKSQFYSPTINQVTHDKLFFLSKNKTIRLPHPKAWSNTNQAIVSLSSLCQSLANYAQTLGVEIFNGYAATDFLFNNNGDEVIGLTIKGSSAEDSMNINAQYTVLAEGCYGYLSQKIINKLQLNKQQSPQTYGLGFKEIWQIQATKHQNGLVNHYIGYPLKNNAYGGGFVYHIEDNKIAIGLIASLDYKNPHLNLFNEFQKFKQHNAITPLLIDGKRIAYGAKTVVEGGVQALPQLAFAGGLLVGDSAGFLNTAYNKGVNNAIDSGILAAAAIFNNFTHKNNNLLSLYSEMIYSSKFYQQLYQIRNIRPVFKLNIYFGIMYAALEHYILRHHIFWTFKWRKHDHQYLKNKNMCKTLIYPIPDNIISFDKTTSIYLSNIIYHHNQINHLQLVNNNQAISINKLQFANPEIQYCPAGVYESKTDSNNGLKINFHHCLHCKACAIKDPAQNIKWELPDGGTGPQYIDL